MEDKLPSIHTLLSKARGWTGTLHRNVSFSYSPGRAETPAAACRALAQAQAMGHRDSSGVDHSKHLHPGAPALLLTLGPSLRAHCVRVFQGPLTRREPAAAAPIPHCMQELILLPRAPVPLQPGPVVRSLLRTARPLASSRTSFKDMLQECVCHPQLPGAWEAPLLYKSPGGDPLQPGALTTWSVPS